MTILEMATLKKLDSIYDFDNFELINEKLLKYMNIVQKKYSNKLVFLLEKMLQKSE